MNWDSRVVVCCQVRDVIGQDHKKGGILSPAAGPAKQH
jgi:hypothetical protein